MEFPKMKSFESFLKKNITENSNVIHEEILIWDEIEKPLEDLKSALDKVGKENTDPTWSKALISIWNQIEKIETNINKHDRKLGAIKTNESASEEEDKVVLVSDQLKEVFECAKKEAKEWADDNHDEHTIESYMSENAALIGALAVSKLKEMKDDSDIEAFEAACNMMIESYTNKVNEMKEVQNAPEHEEE